MDTPTPPPINYEALTWFKAKASSDTGACVEVAWAPEGWVAVRDSKDPTKAAHLFTGAEWAAFVDGAKGGEFDQPA